MLNADRVTSLMGEVDALFEMETDWTRLFDAILGVDGLLRGALTVEERIEFQKTEHYDQIQTRLAEVRKRRCETDKSPYRVITVRLPPCVHAALRTEAHELQTSMNKLCVTKLMQTVDPGRVPGDSKLPVTA